MPGSVDENFVGFAAVNDLRIACDQLHTGSIGRLAHRLHDAPEILHRRSFFENESAGKIERSCATHCQIVDGAVHREFADVAAGKKIGLTTYESVLKATRSLPNEKMAPSCNGSSSSFRNCGSTIFSIN